MEYKSSANLNKATARIYVTKINDNSIASGFFFAFENQNAIFLVTNKHVAENATSFTISLHSSLNENCHGFIDNVSEKVIFHPQADVDLCIMEMSDLVLVPKTMTLEMLQTNVILENMIISEKELYSLNYCEDIIMFGSPHGLYDIKNNLSIAFKGMTATHAGTKFYDAAHFLVDIPSYPGSSGSAIYLCTPETMSSFSKTKVLGIFYQAQYDSNSKEDKKYIHIGKAIPAYKLLDFKDVI